MKHYSISFNLVLVAIAFFVALLGYVYEVSRLGATSVKIQISYSVYVLVVMWGLFLYFYISKLIAHKFGKLSTIKIVAIVVWICVGACLAYVISWLFATAFFYCSYYASVFGYMTWVPSGLTIEKICSTSAVFSLPVNAFLMFVGFRVRLPFPIPDRKAS
jgi:hypothetical protein